MALQASEPIRVTTDLVKALREDAALSLITMMPRRVESVVDSSASDRPDDEGVLRYAEETEGRSRRRRRTLDRLVALPTGIEPVFEP